MFKTQSIATAFVIALSGHAALAHGGGASSAAGSPGDPHRVTRTIEVTMQDDMRFTPSTLTVRHGQTVRFVIHNAGRVRHELMLGSMDELKEHAEMMRAMPGMTHHEANAVTVEPGQSASLVWRFARPGAVDFACLVPGHFEAGMKGVVQVR